MLVLSRRRGENIVVITPQGDITITIIDIDRGQVSVGVNAPRRYPVHREEVAERIAAGERARRA